MVVHVQTATEQDFEQLVSLFDAYRRFYRQRSDRVGARRFLRARLRRKESIIYLARDGRRAVGFVQVYPSFDSVPLSRVWIVHDLFVNPAVRRRGVGEALLDRVRREATRAGVGRLMLETAVRNRAAQRLYRKLGWQRDAQFNHYLLDLA